MDDASGWGRRRPVFCVGAAISALLVLLGLPTRPLAEPSTLVYGASLPLLPLNPLGHEWTEASVALFSRLFTLDRRGTIVGDLVASHEVSADGLSWTLRLRPGVRWHDDTPFTARDVVYTFDQMRAGATNDGRWRSLSAIDRYEAAGGLGVTLHLKAPQPGLATPLADVPILPRHVLDGGPANDPDFEQRPVGTGPYRLAGRTAGGRLVLERHDAYHLGRPAIARMEMVTIEDDEARARAVVHGSVDVAHVKPQQMHLFTGSPNRVVYRYPSGIWRSLVLNVRRPHLRDRRVRRAIALALDRDAMVGEGLLGMGAPAFSPIPPGHWAFPGDRSRPPDLAAARALLDAAGWLEAPDGTRRREGRPLEIALAVWWREPFRRAASEVVRRNLRPLGITVHLIEIPGERYEAVAADLGADYDAIISGYSGLVDPGDNLAAKYATGGSQNAGGYSSPEVDRLLDAARTQMQPRDAATLYRRAIDLVDADAVRVPLVYVDYLFAAHRDLRGMDGHVLDLYYQFPRFAYLLSWPGSAQP